MKHGGRVQFIGVSPQICELQAEAERVARSDAKVLITGESGVGKEILARSIHATSPRVAAPFVPVNCAGIPETLLESELFGHVKGSFTGAYRDKPGKLECANNGTIFLDEMAEMTLRMQGMLLRFLETGEIQKVGADRVAMVTNVRVIAATNRNLRDLIAQGQFREDLFYRLNVVHLTVPPLRERRVDIPPLVEEVLRVLSRRHHDGNGNGRGYLDGAAHEGGGISRAISPEALAALCRYSWPGNVRQLENVIERLVVTGRREVIQVEDLPPEVQLPAPYGVRPRRDRRRSVADELFTKLVKEGESFWTAVYPLYMNREITRGNVRDLVRKGLEEARGNYTIVLRMFNMQPRDYKRFLNFLRKHGCRLSFKEYR
jgi:transcriptional regulator with PAS, ATPase and Fis domain